MRSFTNTLQEQRNGQLVDELSKKFAKLIAAVQCTDKVGELNLKIKLRPRKNTAGAQIEVEDTVTMKVPEFSKSSTVFYAAGDELVREDPNQRKLDGLEIVDTEKKEAKAS